MTSYEQAAAAWVKSTYDLNYEPTDVDFVFHRGPSCPTCGESATLKVYWGGVPKPWEEMRGDLGFSDTIRGVFEQGGTSD